MNRDEIREEVIDTLGSVWRPGMSNLVKHMKENGFFDAPCSTQYHLCKEGGLAEHSLNVYKHLDLMVDALGLNNEIDQDSIKVAALLHDLGKMGDHGKSNYTKAPLLKSGKAPAKPYETNKDLNYEEHEIRSVMIAERFVELTEEEETAILHHNGLYGKLDSSFSSTYDKHKLAFLLHMADMYCSRFVEVE